MIQVYGWLDQYQVIGLNTYPTWFGEAKVAVTPSIRIAVISSEYRTAIITSEDRTVILT